MTQSHQALQEARNLQEELLFSTPPEADLTPDLRLIGFCMSKLGQRDLQLASKPQANIVQLLDYNDIHHRRVSAPRDLSTNHWDLDPDNDNEFPLMIVFDSDSKEPLALYRQGGENWLYSGQRQHHFQAGAEVSLAEDAYEIYRSLPPKVKGPLDVVGFAFGPDRLAVIALFVTSGVVMLFNLSIPILTNTLVSRVLPQNDKELLLVIKQIK